MKLRWALGSETQTKTERVEVENHGRFLKPNMSWRLTKIKTERVQIMDPALDLRSRRTD